MAKKEAKKTIFAIKLEALAAGGFAKLSVTSTDLYNT